MVKNGSASGNTPAALGYRMPAEWEPHVGTWFSWPRPEGISFPGKYDTVPPVYAELIRHLTAVEEVHINVWHGEMEQARMNRAVAKAWRKVVTFLMALVCLVLRGVLRSGPYGSGLW